MAIVLIVDDSPDIHLLLGGWLTKMGHKIVRVDDGYNAVPAFSEHRPQLVFLDYHLPVSTGGQVYSRIRELDYGKTVPIVFISAEPPSELMFVVPAGDPVRFLSKPVKEAAFRETILALLPPAPAS